MMKRIVLGTCGVLLSVSAAWVVAQETLRAGRTEETGDLKTVQVATLEEKYSYAIGHDMGMSFRKAETPLDIKNLVAGLEAGLSGSPPKFDDKTCYEALTQLGARMRKQAMAQADAGEAGGATGVENAKAGTAFLAKNKTEPGVQVTKSGLQYKVLTPGTGPRPGPNDRVRCNYRGTLVDGSEFDASKGNPFEFSVRGGVIEGWLEVVQLMKVGAKWQVVIPPHLAYGNQQRSPLIGPGTTLIFEIELVSIVGK